MIKPAVQELDTKEFKDQLSLKPLKSYEAFFEIDFWTGNTADLANEIMHTGWSHKDFPAVNLQTPVSWRTIGPDHRSWRFHLYSWDALGSVLAAYDHTKDLKYLRYAVDLAVDWSNQHSSLDSTAPFAWYDMAIGLRAYRLAYIVDSIARIDSFGDEILTELLHSVDLHAQSFSDESKFAAHSNHGLYFAAGQLAMANRLKMLPGMDQQHAQALERMHRLIDTQFSSEGVHREHSPEYHKLVLDTFDGLLNAGLLKKDEFQEMRDRIQETLAWFILPNGFLAMFGDTPHYKMIDAQDNNRGSAQPTSADMRAFSESGYFIVRSGGKDSADDLSGSSYLAQTCAFHSRVHKHADDLSFVWFDRGHEILIDPGRFGYLDPSPKDPELRKQGFYYGHPKRVYVESTRAHNTVEIDNRSYQRRGVEPYGSALRRCGSVNNVYYAESNAMQLSTVSHNRLLVFSPGKWLIIYDRLCDEAEKSHEFNQRFHFAPELEAISRDNTAIISLPGKQEKLYMVPLLAAEPLPLIKGQEEPDLLGWIARKDNEFEPCWTGGYFASEQSSWSFATLFIFSEEPPCPGNSKVNKSNTRGKFKWKTGQSKGSISFKYLRNGEIRIKSK